MNREGNEEENVAREHKEEGCYRIEPLLGREGEECVLIAFQVMLFPLVAQTTRCRCGRRPCPMALSLLSSSTGTRTEDTTTTRAVSDLFFSVSRSGEDGAPITANWTDIGLSATSNVQSLFCSSNRSFSHVRSFLCLYLSKGGCARLVASSHSWRIPRSVHRIGSATRSQHDSRYAPMRP